MVQKIFCKLIIYFFKFKLILLLKINNINYVIMNNKNTKKNIYIKKNYFMIYHKIQFNNHYLKFLLVVVRKFLI